MGGPLGDCKRPTPLHLVDTPPWGVRGTAVKAQATLLAQKFGLWSTYQWWWVVSTVVSFTPCFLTISTTCNQT